MIKRFGFTLSCALLTCLFILNLAAHSSRQGLLRMQPYWKSSSDSDSVAVRNMKELERELEGNYVPDSSFNPLVNPAIVASRPDSLIKRDSLLALARRDSLAKQDSISMARVRQYIPPYRRAEGYFSPPTSRRPQAFYPGLGSYWRYETKKDSLGNYQIVEKVGKNEVRFPTTVSLEEYLAARRNRGMETGFRTLAAERVQRRQVQQRGIGATIQLPGSENNTFSNIFGNNTVDLRINGQANVDVAFSQQKREDGGINSRAQFDPTLKQDLRLGVTGTIGDKMRIDINWDTAREFDYENQLKLEYTGYEDEIVKRIIAGNVTLDNRSSLISGARNQFGIRTDLQIGGVNVSMVASQQKSKGAKKIIRGGAEEVEFAVKSSDYEDNKHFFLGYYFRSHWETALAKPSVISLDPGFSRIEKIELWKSNLQTNNINQENLRSVIAIADLGETGDILTNIETNVTALPNDNTDNYGQTLLDDLRERNNIASNYLTNQDSYQEGNFIQLIEGRDYEINYQLGYISLKASLEIGSALAVAYRYETKAGGFVQVGELTGDAGSGGGGVQGDRLILKLLRAANLQANSITWPLTMRNIYAIPARNVQADNFKLNLVYGKSTLDNVTLPNVDLPGDVDLLNATGLDRMDASNREEPDGAFDVRGFVFQAGTGRVIFPYLEPFGERISRLLSNSATKLNGISLDEAKKEYVLDKLYKTAQSVIKTASGQDIYKLKGSYKGARQSNIQLGFLLTEGSVSIRSNGNILTEGTDYQVDYQLGTVQILNPAYLTGENELEIDYNSEQLTGFEQKSILGLRADYKFQEKLEMGLTAMRLTEKTPVDKFRIGQEPISNFIWGIDGRYNTQPAWLTRVVDALPLLQTKEISQFSVTGEFAQLRPRVPLTADFNNSRNKFRDTDIYKGRDFAEDELQGTSYIEDFEGLTNSYSLLNAGLWRLASAPDSIGAVPAAPGNKDIERTGYRAKTAWMGISRQLYDRDFNVQMPTDTNNPVTPISINLIYPNIDTSGRSSTELQAPTLNLFFDPKDRGAYNYTTNFERFIDPAERKKTWGGFMQRIPSGYTNFTEQNIEFVEFVFRAYGSINNPSAKLYIDLGTISEDVIPDGRKNTERGLSTSTPLVGDVIATQARYGDNADNNLVKTETTGNKLTQDLGLDGLSSYDDGQQTSFIDLYRSKNEDGTETIASEQRIFTDFLTAINPANATSAYRNSPEWEALYQRALKDPSGDDFGDFRDDAFFQKRFGTGDIPVEKRFMHHFSGLELNSVTAQREIYGNTFFGSSQAHDSEILSANVGEALNKQNSYFQYEVPLDDATLQLQASPEEINDYVVAQTNTGNEQGRWYKVRIPVKRFSRRVGGINDFSQIQHIRVWTTGHEDFFTLRFERLDLIGAQWRVASALENATTANRTRFEVTSIDNEADAKVYKVPPTVVIRRQLNTNGSGFSNAKEQALQLVVDNFSAGDQRAISKNFTQGLDLLRYKNLRMFAHLHGKDFNNLDLTAAGASFQDKDVRLFLRLGANADKDFYEYELPLKPAVLGETNTDKIWQTYQDVNGNKVDLNSLFLRIADLNALKEDRRSLNIHPDSTWYQPESYNIDGKDARIGVRGNPSLSKITTIVLGVRNYSANKIVPTGVLPIGGRDFKSLTLWLNELRATDYDQDGGYAGIASMNLKLADFATLQANFNTRTAGFGGLDASLSDQQQSRTTGFGVTANVNIDKLLPRRAGWSIPLSYSIRRTEGIPKYSPTAGDVRVSELEAQINESTLNADEKMAKLDSLRAAIQSVSNSQTLSLPISKRESRSEVLQYILDPLTFQYNATRNNTQNPTTEIDKSENWNTGLSYRLGNIKPLTFKPFFFVKKGAFRRLDFNLMPQSITASAGAGRSWALSRQRNRDGLQQDVFKKYPFRDQHNFEHKRNLELQYKPLSFLDLNFGVETNLQVLNKSRAYYLMFRRDSLNYESGIPFTDRASAVAAVKADSINGVLNSYVVERIEIDPVLAFGNINTILSNFGKDAWKAEANGHSQRFSASFNPQLNKYKAISFLQLKPISINTNFRWQNGNVRGSSQTAAQQNGNSIANSLQFNTGLTWQIREMWKRVKFYRVAEEESKRLSSTQATRNAPNAAAQQEAEQRRLQEERTRRIAEITRVHTEMSEQGLKVPPLDSLLTAEGLDKPLAKPAAIISPKKPLFTLPSGRAIARKLILMLGAFRDISFDYTKGKEAQIGNVLNGYSMFSDSSAYHIPWKFRFGFNDRFNEKEGAEEVASNRTQNTALDITDSRSNSDRFSARTALNLSQNLSLNFNADAEIREQNRVSYDRGNDLKPRNIPNGSVRSSAWAFGASLRDVVYKQLVRLKEDRATSSNPLDWRPSGNESPLTNQSVSEDFRKSFLFGKSTLDGRGYLPIPLPNINLDYQGLAKLPFLKGKIQSATLRSGYSSSYDTDFKNNPFQGQADTLLFLGNRIHYTQTKEEINGIKVNERFSPLIGLNLRWANGISIESNWNKTKSYAFNSLSLNLVNDKSDEMSLSFSFSKQGLKLPIQLPFMKSKRLDNTIRLTLTGRFNQSQNSAYNLTKLLERFVGANFNNIDLKKFDIYEIAPERPTVLRRNYNIEPRLSYVFSNRLTADSYVRITRQIAVNEIGNSRTITGGINFRLNISN